MNVFEFRSQSKVLLSIHGPILYTLRVIFLHLGCILQFSSVFTAGTVIEFSSILFVGIVWVNVAIKDIVFIVKKRELEELWLQLDDDDFRAETENELQ